VEHSKPVVDKFFAWVSKQLKDNALLPSNRLTKALNYVNKRKDPLCVVLPLEGDDKVIRIADYLRLAPKPRPNVALEPLIEHVVQVNVPQQRREC
jgi:hypothetical protein